MSQDKKVIFITGANTGLGLETVKALYKSTQSYDIIVGSRLVSNGEAAVAAVQQEISSFSSSLSVVQLDLALDESIKKAVEDIESKFPARYQSEETKDIVNVDKLSGFNGWKPPKTQRINQSESIDIRESFSLTYSPTYDPDVNGYSDIPDHKRPYVPGPETSDFWKDTASVPEFQHDAIEYWRSCLLLARKLIHSFALSLSLPETYFDEKTSYPDAVMSINYYPPIPPDGGLEEENVSIGSHTDFQLFTILWQDTTGGLEVLTPDREWINAVPIKDTLVVNVGDYLMRITNDRYVSTVHRAKNKSEKQRLSMAFFFGYNLSETCQVLPTCIDETHPAKYEPILCADWVRKRAQAMYITPEERVNQII